MDPLIDFIWRTPTFAARRRPSIAIYLTCFYNYLPVSLTGLGDRQRYWIRQPIGLNLNGDEVGWNNEKDENTISVIG